MRDVLVDNARISCDVIRRARGSLSRWIREEATFRDKRNKFECMTLALAIEDAILEGLKPESSTCIERMVRRMTGVHAADNAGSWDLCCALELDNASATLVPPRIFDRAVRRSAQLAKLTQPSPSHSRGGFTRGRGGTHGAPPRGGATRGGGAPP